jgi:hypothetical protein
MVSAVMVPMGNDVHPLGLWFVRHLMMQPGIRLYPSHLGSIDV